MAADFIIQKALLGAKRSTPAPKSRLPIHLFMLHHLLDTISRTSQGYQCAPYRAMFLIAFHGFLRIREITIRTHNAPINCLNFADCSLHVDGVATRPLFNFDITIERLALLPASNYDFLRYPAGDQARASVRRHKRKACDEVSLHRFLKRHPMPRRLQSFPPETALLSNWRRYLGRSTGYQR